MSTGTAWTEAGPAWCRGRIGPCHWWGGRACPCAGFGRCVRPAWCRCDGPADGLLQLHELTGCHRFAHASGHSRTARSSWSGGCTWTATAGGAAIATNRLADQLQGVAAARGHARATLSGGGSWSAWAALALGNAGAGRTARHRLAHQFRSGGGAGGCSGLGGGACSAWGTRTCRGAGTDDLWLLLARCGACGASSPCRPRRRARWCGPRCGSRGFGGRFGLAHQFRFGGRRLARSLRLRCCRTRRGCRSRPRYRFGDCRCRSRRCCGRLLGGRRPCRRC